MNGALVVIPARLQSSRLPRKMLLPVGGKPLVVHTYEAACRARKPRAVLVATDSAEIVREVRRFGGQAVLTSPSCPSGTDRVAEVARSHAEFDVLVNVQGDEPEIDPAHIDLAIELLEQHPDVPMSTLASPIRCAEQLADPACVKVVFDRQGRALYFSRAPIPFARDGLPSQNAGAPLGWQHIGLYAYRREFLLRLAALSPSPLEQIEKLEQLRVLEAGQRILVGRVEHHARGIDTPEDYHRLLVRLRRSA